MIDHDSAYSGLLDGDGDGQWAFGTSFDDPLVSVDTTVPADVDSSALAAYCLMLGDDALIAAQRLSEWAARAPELEEDVALLNIGLDLLGQARLLLARGRRRRSRGRPVHLRVLPGARRGRARLLPRRSRLPVRAAGGGRQR